MPTVTLSIFGGVGAQFFDNSGDPLTGGFIHTYEAGTTTPLATYTTYNGNIQHSNPIILDSAGRVSGGGEIWLSTGIGYKFILKASDDSLIGTYDNIPSSAQPPAANDANSIMYEQGYTVNAGSFIVGYTYRILTLGNTDYTLIGAASNTVGVHFIATGVGSGTGTAQFSRTVQARLRDTVSINDFGASPSATAAVNTAAIEAAMAASESVMVPEGTYSVNTITVPSNVSLFGSSRAGSVLTTSTSSVLDIFNVTNVTVDSLTLTSTGVSYGNTVFVHGASSQIRVRNCSITSAYRTFMAGDNSDTSGPTYVWFENNSTYTTNPDGGIRTRLGSNGTGGVMWFTNNLIVNSNNITPGPNNYEDVGIETWTPSSTIEGNVIVAENLKGGFSGITFGVGATGIARNNRIAGFSAGVEVGGTGIGAHVIDGNIIENCKEGVLVSTGGVEESVTITNNQIIMDEINRNDYTYAIYVQCQAATITNNLVYYKNGTTTYTSASSRKGTGVRGDTNNEQLVILGNVFKNLELGIDLAATSKDIQVVGNDFYNVAHPVYDSGGSPNTYFANNNVQEFKYFQINLYANFCNNEIARSSNYPNGQGTNISSSPFVQSLNSANVVIVNSNNRFTNVLGTAFALDAEYYAQGLGYGRPKIEVIDGTYKVANYLDPAAAIAILGTCGFSASGKTILEWFTDITYVVNGVGLVQTYNTVIPVSGTWRRGDIVWNSMPSSGGAPGWSCTVAGTPGTWKAMANLA